MKSTLDLYLKRHIPRVDAALASLLPKDTETPRILHASMRYSVFAGGKRLRPILTIAAAEIGGERGNRVLPAACAMEMIHTYSLIHDDLPAMDDDDVRRGRETNHIVYGEALAILAGDALLTHAFDLAAESGRRCGLKPRMFGDLIHAVVRGAGTMGMIGGQVADIESESGKWASPKTRFEKLNPAVLLPHIHARKTAALIIASLEVGALLAKASNRTLAAFRDYGHNIGLAFQVKDDILDLVGDKKKLGKRGSDTANKKLTFPALYGLEKSKTICSNLVSDAHESLRPFGKKAAVLHALANFIQDRDH